MLYYHYWVPVYIPWSSEMEALKLRRSLPTVTYYIFPMFSQQPQWWDAYLCIHTALKCPALDRNFILWMKEFVSLGDPDHLMYEVNPGDALCDWMFHLETGVHLQEVEMFGWVDQKFHRSWNITVKPPVKDHLYIYNMYKDRVNIRTTC